MQIDKCAGLRSRTARASSVESESSERKTINLDHLPFLQHNIGMSEPLVDDEGYPRSDIDVYAVRTARNKIISKLKGRYASSRCSRGCLVTDTGHMISIPWKCYAKLRES